jgi:hypothetical protein
MAAIGVAGARADGLRHIEVVDHLPGTGWVVPRLVELTGRHEALAVVCAAGSPAAALLKQAKEAGLQVDVMSVPEHAEACGALFDAVDQGTVRHGGTPELVGAVKGSAKRLLGDSWLWSRKSSATDISPLVACTLALGRFGDGGPSVYEARGVLVL